METKPITKEVQEYPTSLASQTGNLETSEQLNIAAKLPAKDASSLYDFAALDGLRVLACLSVICFHSLLYWGTLLDIDEGEKLLNKVPALRLASFGNAGVDIFLVLTGLWATWQLVPAMEAACGPKGSAVKTGKNSVWSTVKEYYRKRVLRVLPAYGTALALVAFGVNHNKDAPSALQRNHDTVFEYCIESLPLNFVLMNNLIGFGGCGAHFWSLAVQLQFYLAFPLLLLWAAPDTFGFRKRVTHGAVAAFVLTAGLRWAAAHAAGVVMPLPPYAHPNLGPAGADVAATAMLRRRAARFACGLLCSAILVAFYVLVINAKVYGQMKEQRLWNHPQAFAALAYHGSPLFCLAAAAVVLTTSLHTGPLSTLVSAILRSKVFKNLAKVTYDVYLVHMIALYWFEAFIVHRFGSEGTFAAAVAVNPVRGYGAILAVTCLGGYVVGLMHNKIHHMISKSRAKCQVPASSLDQARIPEMQNIADTFFQIDDIPAADSLNGPEIQEDGFLTVFMSDAEAETRAVNQTIDAVSNIVPRIAGGRPADERRYPYAASIAIYGVHACGGALIAPRVVITAAHCVYNKDKNDFYSLRDMTLRIGNVDRSKGQSRWPKGMIIPNTFQPAQGFYGDIAMILLNAPISGRGSKLVTKQKQASRYRALGWGKTEKGYISYILKQVELRGVAAETCKNLLSKHRMGGLPKDHFCAGLNSSGADTCEGDSGGPLLSGTYQAGITSYGPPGSDCGKGVNFGVYTSVAFWNKWVQDSMSVYNLRGKEKPWKFNKPQFNVCYEGGTYKSTTAGSMGGCCEACRASKGCAAWTWSKVSKTCAFKHKGTYQAQRSAKCQSGRFY